MQIVLLLTSGQTSASSDILMSDDVINN